MPDMLIPDLDEAAAERLKAVAERRKLSLGELVAEMLRLHDRDSEGGVAGEIAAMRASQPRQRGDAAEDVRRLRDGGNEPQDATQAA